MSKSSACLGLRRRFRRKRMLNFARMASGCRRVIDLGGTPYNWSFARGFDVTLLNITEAPDSMKFIRGDATRCSLPDGSFDIAFSNSLIEHVGTWDDQKRLAEQIRRLAPHYFVETPNFYFPIEPHCLAPFVQFLPGPVKR